MRLRADTQTQYGLADANPALDDVAASLAALDGLASYGFFFNPELRVRARAHLQSVARLPGPAGEPWFVISKHHHADAAKAGFLFVRFPRCRSDGEALERAGQAGGPGVGVLARFWGHGRSEHPGGLQQCGRVLAVAQDPLAPGATAYVSLVDARAPESPAFMGQLALDGTHGETRMGGLSCAALTRLDDGHALLFAYRYSSNRPEQLRGLLFRSTGPGLSAATSWRSVGELTRGAGFPSGWVDGVENMALINQTDGAIFLAALRGRAADNHIDLYRMSEDGSALSHVMTKFLRTRPGRATLRAGGGLHITPQRGLVLYAVQQGGGSARREMMIEEFSP